MCICMSYAVLDTITLSLMKLMKPELAMPDNMDGAWKNYYYYYYAATMRRKALMVGHKWVNVTLRLKVSKNFSNEN